MAGDLSGSSVSWSTFTVICSVFQVFPAVYKLRCLDSSSRRRKIREMEEEEEEIRRNEGGEGSKTCKWQEENL